MKTRMIFALMITSIFSFAQKEKDSIKTNTDVSIATRNVWRGLDYGSSPMVQGNLSLGNKKFDVGAMGTTTLNGSKGYGTWMELYADVKYKQFTLTVDDYFFFNATDSLNNYFDWSSDKTQHLIEGRLKYDGKRFNLMAGYNFYSNKANNTNGVYIEGEFLFKNGFSLIAGYLTDASWLSSYDKGGVTTVGAVGKRTLVINDIKIPLKASLIFNPNYQNASKLPGIGYNPVNFVLAVNF